MPAFAEALRLVKQGKSLSRDEAAEIGEEILHGDLADAEIAGFLVALSDKGETGGEIAGFATVLMKEAIRVNAPAQCADLCGTGGSGLPRFNVSTAAAFVASACGAVVAKHGNRGSRRPNGSFDLLEALGLPVEVPPEVCTASLNSVGLTFLFARQYHPIMKRVVSARKMANRRTIFNLVGPIANPCDVRFQVIGTGDQSRMEPLAQALRELGKRRAMVVSGHPGIDDLSICGQSMVLDVTAESIQSMTVHPSDYGIPVVDYASIPSGDAQENAAIFRSLLRNAADSSISDMVALNAAAVVLLTDVANSLSEGFERARECIASGGMLAKYDEYESFVREQGLRSA